MQVGIFNCLFIFVIAALNDYVIVASIIVIAIRNLINCAALGGTIHVFVPNRHGTDLSVRCMRPYNEYRHFTPNPEGGARSNATMFDNHQQKNSECC